MEKEARMYSKFGYCKFKSMCKRKHFTEEFNDQNCQEKNSCQKRHPKICKRYFSGNCRFKNYCAFKHSTKIIVKDQCKIEQKVMFLENIFLELTLKLFNVEEELKLCKHNKSSETKTAEINDHKEDFKESNITSDKDIEKELQDSTNDSTEEEDNLGEVFLEIEISQISNKKEEGINNEGVENNSGNKTSFSCDHCSYKCKEENVYQNYVVNKHATNNKAHQCKTCRENFNSLSDVLEHDLKEHQDKQVNNNTSFVFSESMLDEFDPRRGWSPLMS